jgi:hypothetical protein
MPSKAPGDDLTSLLHAWSAGDASARDRFITVVYQDLRRRAAGQLRRERRGHSLEPTAPVHEAYMRLVDQQRVVWRNREGRTVTSERWRQIERLVGTP